MLEPSLPAGVTQEIEDGETEFTAQVSPPIVTVVEPGVSQNPLPVIVMACPPHSDPVSGVTESIAMVLVRRPVLETAFPCPSTFIMISYSPAGRAGGKKVIEVESTDTTSAWYVPSVRRAISSNSASLADLLNRLLEENISFSISLHFSTCVLQIASKSSWSSFAESSSS